MSFQLTKSPINDTHPITTVCELLYMFVYPSATVSQSFYSFLFAIFLPRLPTFYP